MDPRVEEVPFARDHDSVDDFEHLSHDGTTPDYRPERHRLIDTSCVDDLLHIGDSLQQAPDSGLPKALATDGGDETKPVPATPPPSADLNEAQDPFEQPMRTVDPKLASMTFVETERSAHHTAHNDDHALQQPFMADLLLSSSSSKVTTGGGANEGQSTEERVATTDTGPVSGSANVDEFRDVRSFKQPEKPDNFLREEPFGRAAKNIMDDDSWNLVEQADARRAREAPTKPLPPLPKDAELPEKSVDLMSGDTPFAEAAKPSPPSSQQATDSESAKWRQKPKEPDYICTRPPAKKKQEIEIAPKEIFRDMGLDAWFNPEQLNPKVAALIYWRDPKKSGIVFGTILGVLLSLAYFSLISVLAYLSLLVLTGTVLFRVYKTVLQAVQKTSDGHPFKDILDVDLALPAEKVHEVADVAVAHINAVIGELRRLFLVEDLVDSLKFGVLLWCLTYVGSWFNGMTLIIIGVVALFTLPKIYETNKEQIDQNLALVQAKINEVTAKVKAAIPLGKKAEPTKEE